MRAAALPYDPEHCSLEVGSAGQIDSSIAEAESDGRRDRQIQTEMFHR
jgi:hypothetical protein